MFFVERKGATKRPGATARTKVNASEWLCGGGLGNAQPRTALLAGSKGHQRPDYEKLDPGARAGNPTTASNVRFVKSGDQQGVCSKRSSLSHHGCMISISSGALSFSLAPLRGLACAVPRRTGAIWKAARQADRARRDQFLTILRPALQNVALSRGRQVRGL